MHDAIIQIRVDREITESEMKSLQTSSRNTEVEAYMSYVMPRMVLMSMSHQ